jgi:uncharacterized membrane protein
MQRASHTATLGRSRRAVSLVGRAAAVLLAPVVLLSLFPAATLAAGGVTVTTPFPQVAVQPSASVTFPLTITAASTQVVALSVTGLPAGWSARLTGGGFTVDGAYAGPGRPAAVNLDLSVPADATGTAHLAVIGRGTSASDELPLEVRVASEAGGSVSLAATYPSLRGPASATFPFDLTLRNDTPRETTFALSGQGPDGWTVDARPSGSTQATSLTVAAGSSGGVRVSVTPPADAAAGSYPIVVTADGGGTQAAVQLTVVVTGSYSVALTTPDQVLSTNATAGAAKPFQVVVQNTGSGPLTNVTLSARPATGWDITFNPPTIASLDPGKDATVTASITPASNAVAGDYNVPMTATAAESSGSVTIRVTVDTSLTWAIVGIALIVLVLVGLGLVFSRYGRR